MLNKINISAGRQKVIINIVLAVVILTVYGQVNHFDFINIDDTIFVTESRIQSGITLDGIRLAFSTTSSEFWHPLVWLSFMLDYQIYSLNPGGFHITNVILHILSTLLLFWLFNHITGEIWKSAFVAAFFAIHPLRVESVAWVAERKDVLSVFFWMLTLCLYVYYTEKPVIRRYLFVLFSFICALMSKSMVITLPVIMILLDYWPMGRFQSKKGNFILWQLKEKMPLIILSAIISITQFFISDYYQPSAKQIMSWSSRFANASVAFVTYLEKIFYPHDMHFFHPFLVPLPVWQMVVALLLILVISIIVIITVKHLPYLFVGWFWYAITLLPVIGFFSTVYFMHEHYTYLPSIGVSIMLAWGIPLLFSSSNMRQKILFPIGTGILAILAVISWQECGYWKNSLTLYSHAVRVTKHSYLAYYNLGNTYADAGQYQSAIDNYNEVILLKPDFAEAYFNRGTAYGKCDQYQRAIEDFNKAITLKPDYVDSYFNRGTAYAKLDQYPRAIEDFSKAISLKPDYALAYFSRGFAYLLQGNNKDGCHDAKKVCAMGDCRLLELAKSQGHCH